MVNRFSRFVFIIPSLILTFFIFQNVQTASASSSNTILFAVYAPLGSDPNLNARVNEFKKNLNQTVQSGPVTVVALIDTVTNGQPETFLVEVTKGVNTPIVVTTITSWGAQDMNDPQTLVTFMNHVKGNYTYNKLVLSFEGHGGGYVPNELGSSTSGGWLTPDLDGNLQSGQTYGLPGTSSGYPPLPMWATVLPGIDLMSTYQLATALDTITGGGSDPIDIIIFNNCFNLSFELVSALVSANGSGYADYVVGYPNYNFFTDGKTYPDVFSGTTATMPNYDLAERFAMEKYKTLNPDYAMQVATDNPSLGGVIALENVPNLTNLVNALAYELNDAMATDPAYRDLIGMALSQTQHYDTTGCNDNLPQPADFELSMDDDFIDLHDFAAKLKVLFQHYHGGVYAVAADLEAATGNIQVYGDWGVPHMKQHMLWATPWDFTQTTLSLNIFFPMPKTGDMWNWRTYHYVTRGGMTPEIDFLNSSEWVNFISMYHNYATFNGLTRPCTPPAPLAQ